MRQFGQRVGLVHELRELAAAEELLHGSDNRPDVDERAWRRLFRVGNRHAFAHDSLHAEQADAELLLNELAHGAHAAVAEMVDVVRMAAAIGPAQAVIHPDLLANDVDQVLLAKPTLAYVVAHRKAAVELVAAHAAEVVAAREEEQRVQQVPRVVVRWRVAGSNLAIELEQRFVLVRDPRLFRLLADRRRDVLIDVVRVDILEHGKQPLIRAEFVFEFAKRRIARLLFGRGEELGESRVVAVARQQARACRSRASASSP